MYPPLRGGGIHSPFGYNRSIRPNVSCIPGYKIGYYPLADEPSLFAWNQKGGFTTWTPERIGWPAVGPWARAEPAKRFLPLGRSARSRHRRSRGGALDAGGCQASRTDAPGCLVRGGRSGCVWWHPGAFSARTSGATEWHYIRTISVVFSRPSCKMVSDNGLRDCGVGIVHQRHWTLPVVVSRPHHSSTMGDLERSRRPDLVGRVV